MPKTTPARSLREQRRLQHQDLSRNQLLDAAEQVFGRKGFHDTTLKEIAELAEFSVGSVYSFFENKDDLFQQIFARRGAEYMPQMERVLGGRGTPLERLLDLARLQVEFFRERKHFIRLYLRYSSATLLSDERLSDRLVIGNYEAALQRQADVIGEGQASGEIVAGDALVLARMLSGLVSAYQSVDPVVMSDEPADERMTLDEFLDLVARTFRHP